MHQHPAAFYCTGFDMWRGLWPGWWERRRGVLVRRLAPLPVGSASSASTSGKWDIRSEAEVEVAVVGLRAQVGVHALTASAQARPTRALPSVQLPRTQAWLRSQRSTHSDLGSTFNWPHWVVWFHNPRSPPQPQTPRRGHEHQADPTFPLPPSTSGPSARQIPKFWISAPTGVPSLAVLEGLPLD